MIEDVRRCCVLCAADESTLFVGQLVAGVPPVRPGARGRLQLVQLMAK
jgi:hypothetical protein